MRVALRPRPPDAAPGRTAFVSSAHRILVVDDEDKMRRLLEMALRGMGHEVVQASDGVAVSIAASAAIIRIVICFLLHCSLLLRHFLDWFAIS